MDDGLTREAWYMYEDSTVNPNMITLQLVQ